MEMKTKHPVALPDDVIPPPPSSSQEQPPCRPEAVDRALRSFKNGTSGGLDAITPTHIIDMISANVDIRQRILVGLAHVCSIIRNAKTPPEIRGVLYGGWLIALKKKEGGHRPIVAGSIFRKIATKTLFCAQLCIDWRTISALVSLECVRKGVQKPLSIQLEPYCTR